MGRPVFINTVRLGCTKYVKQQEIKSSAREGDAIERRGNHKRYEAAGTMRDTIYSKLLKSILVERADSKIRVKSIA